MQIMQRLPKSNLLVRIITHNLIMLIPICVKLILKLHHSVCEHIIVRVQLTNKKIQMLIMASYVATASKLYYMRRLC